MKAILEIKDLTVTFRESGKRHPASFIEAVSHVDLSIPRGQFISIVGESGSGKSSLAQAITSLGNPLRMSGSITYTFQDEKSVELLSATERLLRRIRSSEISYIFQDPASYFNPVLTIGTQVGEVSDDFGRDRGALNKNRVLECLKRASIPDPERFYCEYPHKLSGGQRQRAFIAMALIKKPKLLIADEPTTALDALTQREIMDLLIKVKNEEKLTIVFITHNLRLASLYSDRIVVMEKGKVVEAMTRQTGGFKPCTHIVKRLFRIAQSEIGPKDTIEV